MCSPFELDIYNRNPSKVFREHLQVPLKTAILNSVPKRVATPQVQCIDSGRDSRHSLRYRLEGQEPPIRAGLHETVFLGHA